MGIWKNVLGSGVVVAGLAAMPMVNASAMDAPRQAFANLVTVNAAATVAPKTARLELPTVDAAKKRGRLPQRWRYRRNEFSKLIEKYADEYDVPVDLAHAMIEVESQFNPKARGAVGEIGLMQIKPATARMVGFRGMSRALYDPETNIKYGMRYLSKARKLGSENGVCGTILKYNAGHGAKRMNPISRRYCEKVQAIFARNKKEWSDGAATTYAQLDSDDALVAAALPVPRFRDAN